MSPEQVTETLRNRIVEFGDRPSYVLFEEEFLTGKAHGLFTAIQEPENRNDGTIITAVIFEGKKFLCVEEDGTTSFFH